MSAERTVDGEGEGEGSGKGSKNEDGYSASQGCVRTLELDTSGRLIEQYRLREYPGSA